MLRPWNVGRSGQREPQNEQPGRHPAPQNPAHQERAEATLDILDMHMERARLTRMVREENGQAHAALRARLHNYRPNYFFQPGSELNETVACVVCEDEFLRKNLYRTMCNHWHCIKCLKANAFVALTSNPFTPAKCCQVIPTESLHQIGALSTDEFKQYEAKMEELTNPRRKLYCWGEDCGAFIPLDNRKRRVGECAKCERRTCKVCRAKSHFGACDKAKLLEVKEGEEEIYRLAEAKGWKRCPNCLNMVQKDGGCNHMT
ncbi:hypothetical protein F5Y19DRAFT_145224 [Xylariaceae sp. FL1651]|nr:hypothetical protein F5Y19DRAFT_145224 [Xylariaceae sp. FL1651]